jgi:predicted enzyme related to lactoylglutathione lyase
MKRFHVNVSVTDISAGIRFYTALFATEVAPQHSTCCVPATAVNAGTCGEARAAASTGCCPA